MLIIDKLLLSPVLATVWAARQIQKAIEQEQVMEPELITAQLSELYMMLETGGITEQEFEKREKELLDRLDEIEERELGVQKVDQTGLVTVDEEIAVERNPASR
jgi:gas vesicle protein GvpG